MVLVHILIMRILLVHFKVCFLRYEHGPDHLIVVFGAGGKDRLKRSLMGAIAQEYADLIILTD